MNEDSCLSILPSFPTYMLSSAVKLISMVITFSVQLLVYQSSFIQLPKKIAFSVFFYNHVEFLCCKIENIFSKEMILQSDSAKAEVKRCFKEQLIHRSACFCGEEKEMRGICIQSIGNYTDPIISCILYLQSLFRENTEGASLFV